MSRHRCWTPRAFCYALAGAALISGVLPAEVAARRRRAPRPEIVASVGPTSADARTVRRLKAAGATRFRINMAHLDEHSAPAAIAAIRDGAGAKAPILADLPGGKLRTGLMADGQRVVALRAGQSFALRFGDRWGAESQCTTRGAAYVDYDGAPGVTLADYARVGGEIWLHQGKLALQITAVSDGEIQTRVIRGGRLSQRATLNLVGEDPAFPEITAEDRAQLALAVRSGVTQVGVSMIQRPSQVDAVRRELRRLGAADVQVVAKIETLGAMEPQALEAIVRRADEVMIARGDLDVAFAKDGDRLRAAERTIAATCRRYGKPCMDATGFMSNLRQHSRPSLDNLRDVAHARSEVQPDSIMLKGTAINGDPVAPVYALRKALRHAGRAGDVSLLVDALAAAGGTARVKELAAHTGMSRSRASRAASIARWLGLAEGGGKTLRAPTTAR